MGVSAPPKRLDGDLTASKSAGEHLDQLSDAKPEQEEGKASAESDRQQCGEVGGGDAVRQGGNYGFNSPGNGGNAFSFHVAFSFQQNLYVLVILHNHGS